MQTNLLFPYRLKKAGWLLLIPGLLMGLFFFIIDDAPVAFELPVLSLFDSGLFSKSVDFFKLTRNNIFDEIACLLILSGGILVAFSKEKTEQVIGILKTFDLRSKGVDYNTTGKPENELLSEMVWLIMH